MLLFSESLLNAAYFSSSSFYQTIHKKNYYLPNLKQMIFHLHTFQTTYILNITTEFMKHSSLESLMEYV